jgi:hypothetical protein
MKKITKKYSQIYLARIRITCPSFDAVQYMYTVFYNQKFRKIKNRDMNFLRYMVISNHEIKYNVRLLKWNFYAYHMT